MKCTCDVKILFDQGCLCGGFKHEQALKKAAEQKAGEKEPDEKPGNFVGKKARVYFFDSDGQKFFVDRTDEEGEDLRFYSKAFSSFWDPTLARTHPFFVGMPDEEDEELPRAPGDP